MLHRLLAFALITFLIPSLAAQGTFRSKDNPLYWKNKVPFAGYWQQDVAYTIDAVVDESTNIILGNEQLTYYNNSPDTLYYVYFNLYQNAFQPHSYLDDLQHHNGEKPRYGKYEKEGKGISIDKIMSDGQKLSTQLDNTVMKVLLSKPLAPNQAMSFELTFRTFYDNGSTRRRMKKYRSYGFTHYNGCQWYPKICVYDRKSGWNADQHLNREFYGDYGTFDISLDFASNYVVEATGLLQNEKEVLPDTLKAKLQIKNFKDKKWEEKPSIITPYKKEERKTWRYHAENVHDFAFTADPTYRIADTVWNGIHCTAIVQEPHAAGWQNAANYTLKIIQCFSRDFGLYEYPKMVVADAADGMEYPMLTLDAGRNPEYHGLLVHEIGHNWFYGMLGNNETYRAMMDEGFTQFLTIWGLEHIDGDTMPIRKFKSKLKARYYEPTTHRDNKAYNGYIYDALMGNDEPLNTHSDMFNGALGQGGGYRHVYIKTATMLYNLQYLLGDSIFAAVMKHYVSQWKICHPYPEDFRNSVIQYTHVDLNWFFDEWLETTKKLDYKIVSVRRDTLPQAYQVKLKRKGRMQMPIDLRVIAKDNTVTDYSIPNTWYEKDLKQATEPHTMGETPSSTKMILPKWYGWDKLKPTYTATITAPGGIKNIIIDPSDRLADINMYNNRWRHNARLRFDSHLFPVTDRRQYRLYMRPDIWYNSLDGVKLGLALSGNYLGVKNKFELNVWLNTHLGQGGAYTYSDAQKQDADWLSYSFSYSTPLGYNHKNTYFRAQSRWLDGYEMYSLGITQSISPAFSWSITFKGFTRPKSSYRNYLIHPAEWSTYWDGPNKFNASMNLSASYAYRTNINDGRLTMRLRSATLTNAQNYHYLELEHKNNVALWRLDLHTRVYGRVGTGNNLPSESALYYSGANGEEMMDNKYMRAAAFTPQSWGGYGADINHLQYGGGLNLRGYAGYGITEIDKYGVTTPAYKGASGMAINAELDFNRIITVKSAKLKRYVNLNTYVFSDGGIIAYTNSRNEQELSSPRLDAGAGLALTIKYFGLENVKPFTIRFDVPFLVTAPPNVNQRNVDFRWMVGINRAF